ncbi:hypothetical protein LWP59_33110 [Amycolatopsis acidiphila]|uniref:Uncharacterized protein n=1 Tax=Amycolatopsis acidiphila TaxID=715473 RepID=A0A558A1N3_9PSEU|nr:hypothetical protein [Amycolatopsis acidiphila]TVT18174.1 hypothetical protein FNH06_28765 [Amycolatopsis acidiphila]UIJ58874.1 hypothetical protein LWP59_33110 [Amycolatopsis acidiphila]GHG72480.1 hypothetical protein GCM10017788_35040 [Amycolatopsis acidiphila]
MTFLALATAGLTALTLAPAPPAQFDFSDCPSLPAAADPAEWRCEVLVSQAKISFGRIGDLDLGTMRLTFAEGTLDGEYAQAFGALRDEPTRLPGLPGTSVRLRYAGYSDFQSSDQRKGAIDLTAAIEGPLLHPGCASTPIHSVLQADGPTEVISTGPLTLKFSTTDNQLTFPATTGCGPLGPLLDHRLGLPSAASYEQTSYVRLRSY